MKRTGYLSLFLLGYIPFLCAQEPVTQASADTVRTIRDVEIWGRYLSGLSGGTIQPLRVERQPSSVNVSVAEAFRQLPSVVTDIEGGILFRGSTKTGMLIDGVPYGLLEEYSGDVLIQLPSLFFNRIALNQMPRIDQVPDGDAGLLNLSSESTSDAPLSLTIGAGWHERYNAGAVLNLNPGRFHIVAKYNYRREYRERSFSKTTVTKQNTQVMNNNADARPDVHLADLSVGYDLSKRDLLGVHGLFHRMDYSRYGRINNQVFNPAGEQMKHVIRNRYNDQRQDAYAAEVYWKHQFRAGGLFSMRFNYNDFLYDEDNDYKNENPQTSAIIAEDNQFINHDKHNYYWEAKITYPFSDNSYRLNAGYIGRQTEEAYRNDVNAKQGDTWSATEAKCYQYDYRRSLHLLFAALEKKSETWEAELGVQAEFNHREMDEQLPSSDVNPIVSNTYFHLYPHVLLAYHPVHEHQWSLAYQQRVIRPLGSELCSFVDNSDATHVFLGNPELKDEYVHTLELNYRFALSNFRFTPALYYRNRTNRIVEMVRQMGEESVWQKTNAGNSQTFGFDLSARWQPWHFLIIGLAGNVYRDEIDGRTIGYDEKKSLWCGDVKGNMEFRFTPTTTLQIDGFYITDQLTAQGKIKHRYTLNAGLSQYFLQKKLCASLSLHNIFDSLEETTLISTEQMQMTQKRNRDARVAWLTLTYQFL